MKCAAKRVSRAAGSLKLGRTFFVLASLVLALPRLPAESVPPVASAKYSGGTCELRVASVSQTPSTQNRRSFAVAVELQLGVPAASGSGTSFQLPEGFYLDNDATPLLAASVIPGKNLAKTDHLWSVQRQSSTVTHSELEIGDARQRLQGVDVELVLTKVTEWETRNFQAQMGWSDFTQCGPFEVRTFGQAQQLRVDAWSYPQFKKEHDAYRQRMPVTFLNQVYAMQELKVVDAANRSPTSMGSTIPESGAASSTFTGWKALENTDASAPSSAGDDIVYPVSLSVKLPKRYEKERVKFHFDEIRLPAPEKSSR